MFVNALENGQLGLHQNQCTFQKFIACLWEGLIHEWKNSLLALTLPLVSTLRILIKVQPSTHNTGPWSPTRLGIWPQDLDLPNEYIVLATVAFLLLLDINLLPQTGITHYS